MLHEGVVFRPVLFRTLTCAGALFRRHGDLLSHYKRFGDGRHAGGGAGIRPVQLRAQPCMAIRRGRFFDPPAKCEARKGDCGVRVHAALCRRGKHNSL
jgi:hypothetical protein